MTRSRWSVAAVLVAALAACASTQAGQPSQPNRDKDPRYQYNLGLFYLNSQSGETGPQALDKAIGYLETSLRLDAKQAPAWNALGLARAMKGQIDGALQAYRKCLEIQPGFTEAHNNLGTLYQEMGLPDKAEEEWRRVLLDANYRSRELPLYNIARLYYTMDRLDEALETVGQSISASPRFAMAYGLRGMILEKKKDYAGAVDAYRQALKHSPDDASFTFALAAASYENGDLDQAEELFTKILDKTVEVAARTRIQEYLKNIKAKRG